MNYKEKFLETINKIAKDEVNKVEINQCYLNVLESQDKEIERLNNIINELEKDLIEYFKREYPDRKLEEYNLKNCTYDYALIILGKLQELKGSE